MKLFIHIQFIHKVSYKLLRNGKLHHIIILVDTERFHRRSKIEQLHQTAGGILFRCQNLLQTESLQHRFVYRINGTGKDTRYLFLLQQCNNTYGGTEILTNGNNDDIYTIQRQHRQ